MNNKASILCLLKGIETVEEYALLIGISITDATLLLRKKLPLTKEIIDRNCQVFNCSRSYFLCLE